MEMESRKRPREVTNKQDQRFQLNKKTQHKQTPPPNKTISITMGVNQATYEVMQRETDSLYAALITLNAVRDEIQSHQGKEMLARGTEGIEGFIHLGMPLSCFPEGSHVVVTFSKTKSEQKEDNSVFARDEQSSADCVKFHIHSVEKSKKRILKCGELHKEGNVLCVYGFKGQTIKDTLKKDGRFLPFVENDHWKLVTDLDTIIENTQLVDELEGKLFQVEMEMEKSPGAVTATAQKSKLARKKSYVLKEDIVEEYPVLKRECEKMRAYIKEKSEKRKKKTSLLKAHRTNFLKQTQNSTPGKVIKRLSQLSNSVGIIVWNHKGSRGSATCFVFRGLYIFTCRHVINGIVGKGTEPSKWAEIISQSVRVTFDYEEIPMKEDGWFSVEPWFEISDIALDYAVLKLKEDGQQVPAGLYNAIDSEPASEVIYMIGHPDGDTKVIDGCVMMPQGERGREYQDHAQGRESAGGRDPMNYIYMYTQRSFQKNIHKPDVVICDTTFYCGSSGSPVFDSEGSLVAMSICGFSCEYQCGVSSILEVGSAVKSILADIQQKHETWYSEVCANYQDVEMLSLEY